MNEDTIISKNTASALKGISSIEIMLGHLGIATNFIFLYPNRKAGILFVGLFFLLSGYGLMNNLKNKDNYINEFLGRRVLNVAVPVIFVYFFMSVVELGIKNEGSQIISRYISFGYFLKNINWYVYEIILFYLVFYFLYKNLNERYANIALICVTVSAIFIGYFCKIDNPWYGSSICFPLGVIYSQKEYRWNRFLKQKYLVKNIGLLGVCFLFIVIFFIMGNDSVLGNPIARNIAAATFALWVISILLRISVEHLLFMQLGKISYEIFLVHPFWIRILKEYFFDMRIYFVICIVFSICSAILIHFLIGYVKNLTRKLMSK